MSGKQLYPSSIGNALVDVIASHTGDRSEREMERLLRMEQSELLDEFAKRIPPNAIDICLRIRRQKFKASEIETLIQAYHKDAQPQ